MKYEREDVNAMKREFGMEVNDEKEDIRLLKTEVDASLEEFVKFNNIKCFDAYDNITEFYPEVYLTKSPVGSGVDKWDRPTGDIHSGPHASKDIHEAMKHCEDNGLFLPSSQLYFNMVVALADQAVDWSDGKGERINDSESFHSLMSLIKPMMAQPLNTTIDYTDSWIVHYPTEYDLPSIPYETSKKNDKEGLNLNDLNSERQLSFLPFDKSKLIEGTLDDYHTDYRTSEFLQNMTGVHNIDDLEKACNLVKSDVFIDPFVGEETYEKYCVTFLEVGCRNTLHCGSPINEKYRFRACKIPERE